MSKPARPIGKLVEDYESGNLEAMDELLPMVYSHLRKIARSQLRGRIGNYTISPTELVHEAFLRLDHAEGVKPVDRNHFLAIASQCMRWVLADYAKGKHRAKRGGVQVKLQFKDELIGGTENDIDLVLLNDLLEKLAAVDARLVRIIELRFLGGMNIEETAALMQISPATVKREWKIAKAWLIRELKGKEE